MQKNYYQILGVARNATTEAIQAAHAAKRQQFASHPEAVQLMDHALRVLADPERRQGYDRDLAAETERGLTVRPAKPRRRLSGVLCLLGGALAAGAYGWHALGRSELPPTASVPLPTATRPAPPPLAAAPAADETPTITLTPLPPVPAAAGEAAATESRQFTRPAKKPGFDAAYMAWTVYLVVGAKGRGSGVMVAPDKIVTNCHVIAGSYQPRSIIAINSVTREAIYPEKIAILSSSEDVCLLHAPGAPNYVASWGSANALPIGAPTYTVSFPGGDGMNWAWSSGSLVSRDDVSGLSVLLTDNYCRPGVSGGPLFDEEGRVIGITSAGRKYRLRSGDIVQGECVSIEAETAKEVMWRTLMSLAIAPIKYDGVWSGR